MKKEKKQYRRLIVQKYGGTSVGSIERINKVAENIKSYRKDDDMVIAVLSAMGDYTDDLIDFAMEITDNPSRKEMDVLLSSGEQISVSLLAMALHRINIPAKSYMGWQIPIKTDDYHTNARIESIDTELIEKEMEQGYVIIIPGFQGIYQNNITTLGRGGSDTTAVAVAAATKADECQIYTDVEGIYTADPRIDPSARMLDMISLEEMLELSGLGSKVLNLRSVGIAANYKVPLRVLSSFTERKKRVGTLVVQQEDKNMEKQIVSGIAHSINEAKISIVGVPDNPGIAAKILDPLSTEGIEVDMILQNDAVKGLKDFTFTVPKADYKRSRDLIQDIIGSMDNAHIKSDHEIAKVSIVGLGMKSHAGVAVRMFKALAAEGINIQIISTSEIKVSIIVDQKYAELAVRALHKEFNLDKGAAK